MSIADDITRLEYKVDDPSQLTDFSSLKRAFYDYLTSPDATTSQVPLSVISLCLTMLAKALTSQKPSNPQFFSVGPPVPAPIPAPFYDEISKIVTSSYAYRNMSPDNQADLILSFLNPLRPSPS